MCGVTVGLEEEEVASGGLVMTSGCSQTQKNKRKLNKCSLVFTVQVIARFVVEVLINPSEESSEQGLLRQD